MISPSSRRSPSISAASSAPVRSSRGRARRSRDQRVEVAEDRAPPPRSPAGGTSVTPSSRCTTASAQVRSSVAVRLRHAEHLADHVHRQLAGEVGDEVAAAGLDERDRCSWRASSRMRGSSSATRRGVKPRDTSARMRVWRGGSMARNDIVACAARVRTPPGRATRRCGWRSARCRGTPRARRRGATAPRSRAARCGRPAPRRASRRRPGTGPRGSRRRTDRTRACGAAVVATPFTYCIQGKLRVASAAMTAARGIHRSRQHRQADGAPPRRRRTARPPCSMSCRRRSTELVAAGARRAGSRASVAAAADVDRRVRARRRRRARRGARRRRAPRRRRARVRHRDPQHGAAAHGARGRRDGRGRAASAWSTRASPAAPAGAEQGRSPTWSAATPADVERCRPVFATARRDDRPHRRARQRRRHEALQQPDDLSRLPRRVRGHAAGARTPGCRSRPSRRSPAPTATSPTRCARS